MDTTPPGGGRGGNHDRYENKKDRFPNYLHHIPPEDDPLATRTLFAGNLEINITEEELRRIFGHYGLVEDVDIKRPPPGTGNAYAFVRFENLDQANRCKVLYCPDSKREPYVDCCVADVALGGTVGPVHRQVPGQDRLRQGDADDAHLGRRPGSVDVTGAAGARV